MLNLCQIHTIYIFRYIYIPLQHVICLCFVFSLFLTYIFCETLNTETARNYNNIEISHAFKNTSFVESLLITEYSSLSYEKLRNQFI